MLELDSPTRLLKFLPPTPPAGYMRRPRLEQKLARGIGGRLILLLAPGGYGKTSLLASAAREWGRFAQPPTASLLAWYQLDDCDDDAAVFVEGLVESVRRVAPGFGKDVQAVLRDVSDARQQMGRLMALFIDELREVKGGGVFLTLDGFHHVTDRAISEAIERHLLDPTGPLRLIVATRSDPRFYLSALRSRDELVEIRAEDLRFTSEEIRDLLLQHAGRKILPGCLEEVERESGGWPSAAKLATLLVARDGTRLPLHRLAPTQHGYERLVREVLTGFPPERKDDLLRTSLLRQVDAVSCAEGVGLRDPEAFLRWVMDTGLPLTKPTGLDQPYCYDSPLRSALEQELAVALLPHEFRALQRQVAFYYAARGETGEALRHYLQAEDYEEAAATVEQVAESELARGHLETIAHWLRSLPNSVRRRHPKLLVLEARLSLVRDRLLEARALLVTAHEGMSGSEDDLGTIGRYRVAWAVLHLLEGRYSEARQTLLEALDTIPEDDASVRAEALWLESRALELTGDLASAFSSAARGLMAAEKSGRQGLATRAMLQLGRLALLRGAFAESLALSGRAVQRSALLGVEKASICAAGGLAASIYLERGQEQEAMEVATEALETSRRLYEESGQVRACLALAGAHERLGQADLSQERLKEATTLAGKLPVSRPERTTALLVSAASLLRRGRRRDGLGIARQALQTAAVSSQRILMDQCNLVVASAEMSGVRMVPSLLRVRGLRDAFQRSDSGQWLSASLRLLAAGCRRLGLRRLARGYLARSVDLATQECWSGLPMGLPSEEKRLLVMAVRESIVPEVAGSILGVELNQARNALAPLLRDKNPAIRFRAEQASKGAESGTGKAATARLLWPGLGQRTTNKPDSVSLCSLGEMRALVDGTAVEWPSLDVRNLMAYLLVNRHLSLPRERVLKDLWPDSEGPRANLRLQVALYRIRETLGVGYPTVVPLLEIQGTYRWEGAECAIDAEQFRSELGDVRRKLEGERPPTLSDSTVSLLEDAVSLYQGEFLIGISFDWCVTQREDLRAQLLWATRWLIDHYMSLGEWREAIRHGLKALRSDPLREDVVRDVMLCYYRSGDRNSVLQQYREVKRLLAREQGIWPSEETRRLRVMLLGS